MILVTNKQTKKCCQIQITNTTLNINCASNCNFTLATKSPKEKLILLSENNKGGDNDK